MKKVGYARVSTIDQDLDLQLSKLKAEGCEIIRSEKVSGASRDGREELKTVIEFLRKGDELIVTRLDRLGRYTRDVFKHHLYCEQRECHSWRMRQWQRCGLCRPCSVRAGKFI